MYHIACRCLSCGAACPDTFRAPAHDWVSVSLKSLLTAARLIDLEPPLRSCEKQRISDGKRTCTTSPEFSGTTVLSSGSRLPAQTNLNVL